VCDEVSIPVIAAGGIADGRGFSAALMLGACAIQIGHAVFGRKGVRRNQNYKDMVLKAGDISTRRDRTPLRQHLPLFEKIRSAASSSRCEFHNPRPRFETVNQRARAFGALRKAAVEGDTKAGCFMAGQIAGLVTRGTDRRRDHSGSHAASRKHCTKGLLMGE
jgi:enoyl-[acyl-carrier protein] reductase II